MKFFISKEIINKIRDGYYSALYFNRTKHILLKERNFKSVTMQIFQKNNRSVLCGVKEVTELIKAATGYNTGHKWIDKSKALTIKSLKDGSEIKGWDPVMHIIGPYVYFAHLESIYLGILARRTLVATNARKVVNAAKGKPIIFFGDRFDYFLNQEGDGYAACVGGARAVCTQAQSLWFKGNVTGTIPHSLIAINDGDTVKAVKQFAKYIKNANVIALVDFENDCIKTSLEVARSLKRKLWGVRVDTAENITDKSLKGKEFSGVNPSLIKLLRKALDQNGFNHIKIIASGGFCEEKIKLFEKERTPVDIYGVGSALLKGNNDFTADVVMVEDKLIAKEGRRYKTIRHLKNKSLNYPDVPFNPRGCT